MGRLKLILALISHYKYAITIIIGILTVGFVDENSFLHRFQLEMQINDLEEEIDKYNAQNGGLVSNSFHCHIVGRWIEEAIQV